MKKAAALALAVLILAGCSGANNRDLENVEGIQPDKIETYLNIEQHPNITRLCIDGKAFITTTRKRFALIEAPYWDTWCGTDAQ